jgi:hypothetical protein
MHGADDTALQIDSQVGTVATAARIVFGSREDGATYDGQWVGTLASDFNTLTRRADIDLFGTVVQDLAQTALSIGRLVCVASGPEHFSLSAGALRVLQEENAGGASEFSEAVSLEYLHRLYGVELEQTEMAIEYEWGSCSKKTDYTCRMPGRGDKPGLVLAVSVTRAMRFKSTFSEADAVALLKKKLAGIQSSNRDVCPEYKWHKQCLHIFTETVDSVHHLRTVFLRLLEQQPDLVGNTIVLITLTKDAPFLYYNFCVEQARMSFAAFDDAAVVTNARIQTIPKEDDGELIPSCVAAVAAPTEFWYGYRTREEALKHGALLLIPSTNDDDGDNEDDDAEQDLGLGTLWAL